ncbi:MAG: glycosyltransferase [Knoellia sp.]
MKVGWYVHHHGAGHRTRAMVVGACLAARGADVTLLGSELDHPATLSADLTPVRLALDHPLASEGSPERDDVTAGGLMHWAPLRHGGFAERMTTIARWIQVQEPDVLVVDVSCEVALLVRLLGVPVIVVAQPGERLDPPHFAALAAATAVLAPWPAWAGAKLWDTQAITAPVVAVGGLAKKPEVASRPRGPVGVTPLADRTPVGLVLSGSDGFDRRDLPEIVARSAPDVDWTVVGGSRWVPDVHKLIAGADVVVTHAGQNAIADVAAAGVPAVVVPQRRPFGEQDHMADVLASSGLATTVMREDVATVDWAAAVDGVLARGGGGWQRWACEGAVERAASLVESVAHG